MVNKIVIAMILLMVAGGAALAEPFRTQINAVRAIPGTQMQMVESDGQAFFVSPNGRYVLRGTLHDMWSGGEKIETVRQLEEKAEKIDLSQMKLDLDDITDLSLGAGPKEVALFVAPGCPHCKNTLGQITEQMKKDYTFKVIPLPILGKTSQQHTRQLACEGRKDSSKALEMLISGKYPETIDERCSLEKVARATITAKLLDITGVPFLIAPDGRIQKGAPKSLEEFLSQESR